MIAIGSGGFYGKGFTAPNTQVQLGFLPSTIVHTDFIFAAIGEQLGFVGTITLVAAFGALLLTGLLIAASATDDLGRLVAVGIITLLFYPRLHEYRDDDFYHPDHWRSFADDQLRRIISGAGAVRPRRPGKHLDPSEDPRQRATETGVNQETGVLEYWSIGVLEYWSYRISSAPAAR